MSIGSEPINNLLTLFQEYNFIMQSQSYELLPPLAYEEQRLNAHLSGNNATYLEAIYEDFLKDPHSVPLPWRNYFKELTAKQNLSQGEPHIPASSTDVLHSQVRQQLRDSSVSSLTQPSGGINVAIRQARVGDLISAYRHSGHRKAILDPLNLKSDTNPQELQLEHHGLNQADLDRTFSVGSLHMKQSSATLQQIVTVLDNTYCKYLGAEFTHLESAVERDWLQRRIESVHGQPHYERSTKLHLLERLTAAEGLEKQLATRYPGTKRFGLEGAESLIPLIDNIIQRLGSIHVKEVVIGMAHRGRLNVLVNIFGKNPTDLFAEFENFGDTLAVDSESHGDVKYHQGFSSDVMTQGGNVHIALAFNPSHLEIVAPVVVGSVRARQERRQDSKQQQVVPLIIHGDAAFAGQGVVMETFQLSQTRAYGVGGSIHIVVNNQIGFTTSRREDARSTEYCTDIAKMVQAPIFHVNGDEPEAVYFATDLAVDYRQQFGRDVVIDLVCYRRHGHNEADDPYMTQPLMYQKIKQHPTVRSQYAKKLTQLGLVTEQEAQDLQEKYRHSLESGGHETRSLVSPANISEFVDWHPYLNGDWDESVAPYGSTEKLCALARTINQPADGFHLHKQVKKVLDDRLRVSQGNLAANWGFAELLAYATLIEQGYDVRITGQDVGRGTFSHRHAVLHDQQTGKTYTPLEELGKASEKYGQFSIYDSLLSELAVLGFEYGYATTTPTSLVVWEAQFGDFANSAQQIIDQFITSGEYKWARVCGLTLLLPHGYEGQGPEHSSARLERFLQLTAQNNIQICVPTTPAQIFHLLRRQMLRAIRKPLIVMTPKSLLRHPEVVSTMDEFAHGYFNNVLPDTEITAPAEVEKVLLCSGKVYYDLLARRRTKQEKRIAIIRLEQLYPFPYDELGAILAPYVNIKSIFWCQEEPRNQGTWYLIRHRTARVLKALNIALSLGYIGRDPSASTAAGYTTLHTLRQNKLIDEAFELD